MKSLKNIETLTPKYSISEIIDIALKEINPHLSIRSLGPFEETRIVQEVERILGASFGTYDEGYDDGYAAKAAELEDEIEEAEDEAKNEIINDAIRNLRDDQRDLMASPKQGIDFLSSQKAKNIFKKNPEDCVALMTDFLGYIIEQLDTMNW